MLLLLRLLIVAWRPWGAAFLVGALAAVACGILRLGPVPAAAVGFAAGLVAATISVLKGWPIVEVFGVLFAGSGLGAGLAVAVLGLGVPVETFADSARPMFGLFLGGWITVGASRGLRRWRTLRRRPRTPADAQFVRMFPLMAPLALLAAIFAVLYVAFGSR